MLSFTIYCPDALAECALNIQSDIRSGWHKKNVDYETTGNILRIVVDDWGGDDSDSIYIGNINGCSQLRVRVLRKTGRYSWGGKAIGLSIAYDQRKAGQWGKHASFLPPRGHKIEDGFIKSRLSRGTTLIYDVDEIDRTMYFGAKVFLGADNRLVLEFDAH